MDEYFNLLQVLILLIFVMVLLAVIWSYKRLSKIKGVFEVQAIKRNGSFSGRFLRYNLTFSYENHTIKIDEEPGSRYQTAYTRISTKPMKIIGQKARIYSESWASGIGKKLGMQDIQIGSSEFDDKFVIKGSDELFVINLLSLGLQDKLLSLRNFKPTVTIRDDKLMINVPRVLKTEIEYDLLIEAMLKIIDRLNEI